MTPPGTSLRHVASGPSRTSANDARSERTNAPFDYVELHFPYSTFGRLRDQLRELVNAP